MRLPGLLLVLLLGVMAAQTFYFRPRIPERMATQFDREGNPSSWMSRDAFLAAYLGLAACLGAVFLLVPMSTAQAPDEEGHRRLGTVKAALMWAGAGTLGFLLCVGHLTFRANLGGGVMFREYADHVLIGYAVFLGLWGILFLRAIRSRRMRCPIGS